MRIGYYKNRRFRYTKRGNGCKCVFKAKLGIAGEIHGNVPVGPKYGRILTVGWEGEDFTNNMITIRQFIRIPRIIKSNGIT